MRQEGRRVKDTSQVPPAELEKTGGVHLGEQERGGSHFAFEGPEDNQGTSTGQVAMSRGEVLAPRRG